jgi:hypothetical protein
LLLHRLALLAQQLGIPPGGVFVFVATRSVRHGPFKEWEG